MYVVINKADLISGAMDQSPSKAQPLGAWKLSFGRGSCLEGYCKTVINRWLLAQSAQLKTTDGMKFLKDKEKISLLIALYEISKEIKLRNVILKKQ